MRDVAQERLASHKKHNAAEDGRRRREETTLSLRKKKQVERLAKRRNLVSTVNNTDAPNGAEVTPATNGSVGTTETPKVASISELPSIVEKLQNYDLGEKSVTDAVRAIRRMLSAESNPPVDEVIASGALPHLVKLLQCDVAIILFESAWALTNVASTTRTRAVVDCGAVPHLVNLLRSIAPDVREQAAWCLGNIAGDGPDLRDAVLQAPDCIDAFHANLSAPANPTLLQNTVWAVSNLYRGKPQPPLEIVGPLIPVLCSIVMESDTQEMVTDETLADSLWALSYISDGTDNHIDAVLQTGVTSKLVDITKKENPKHVTPAFRVLGNFATGSEPQTQAVIDAGVLPVAHKLMTTGSKKIRKEACWLLSNVAAGTEAQIDTLFHRRNLLLDLSNVASSREWEIRKEAIWATANIFTGGSDCQVRQFVNCGGIEAICSMLGTPSETAMIHVALEAIERFLSVSEAHDLNYGTLMDECGGIEALENLQEHQDNSIYNRCVAIIERFFDGDQDEAENLAPAVDGDNFGFGMESPKMEPFKPLSHEDSPMAASAFNNTLQFS